MVSADKVSTSIFEHRERIVEQWPTYENDVLFQKVAQAYSEKNPSAPIRSRT